MGGGNKMTEEFKIVSEEVKFWTDKKEMSERIIKQLKEDIKEIPKLIKFHESVVQMCINVIEVTEAEEKVAEVKQNDISRA